jgi:hypothetical protein
MNRDSVIVVVGLLAALVVLGFFISLWIYNNWWRWNWFKEHPSKRR